MNPKLDWILRGLVALAVIFIGIIPKLTGDATMVANFERWGYPAGFHLVVGAAETLGVVLLLNPSTAMFGAGLVVVLMLGATGTHLKAGELAFAPIPVAIGAMAAWTAWPRWKARRKQP